MPFLPDLPTELLVQIMRYLSPDDVDNFSGSGKEFRIIADRILPRHKKLKCEYSEMCYGVFHSETLHPIFLLRDILQDPEIAWYVKTMFIGSRDDYYVDKDKRLRDKAQEVAMNDKDGIIKVLKECPYLDDKDRKLWIKNTLSCHQGTVAALLVCMFPCLENIFLTYSYEYTELYYLAQKIGRANRLDPGGSHALSKLRCVEEAGSDKTSFSGMRSFMPFSSLPSMRRYKGRYLDSNNVWMTVQKMSTITSIELDECIIHLGVLRSAFSGIANLQVFTYKYYWASKEDIVEYDWVRDWQPGLIVLSLLEFAGHSLVHLDLTRNGDNETLRAEKARWRTREGLEGMQEDEEEPEDEEKGGRYSRVKLFMGSLQGFQVLTYIRVQNEAFVEENLEGSATVRTVHRLVDLLPASAVVVVLAAPQLCKKESYRLMEGLPELKAERVPELKKIIIESDRPYKDMKTIFKSHGIELIL